MSDYLSLIVSIFMLIVYVLICRKDFSTHFKLCIVWLIFNIICEIFVVAKVVGVNYVEASYLYVYVTVMSLLITFLRRFRMITLFLLLLYYFISKTLKKRKTLNEQNE